MIGDFAAEFWNRRAQETEGSIRWTDDAMLRHDRLVVGSVLPPSGGSLLDLGCGTGDLFAGFLDRLEHVTAVDMVATFVDRLPKNPKVDGVVSGLTSFEPTRVYDTGVLFGVVTHLTPDDEMSVYRLLRRAVPKLGAVVVKNQCSRGEELLVDRLSEAFGQRYVGRYPSIEGQRDRLALFFDEVAVRPYPEELNPWPESQHVAFVCR
ncbi:class I SAM-dependent methyltransferase [Blastococcus sp. CT_GayMR20]|uniref:class I SAM-dependent methyltransferase n=1 Tax=Blastococcus sp. CT_GayMR20 TaxID=2559609 RepID=UPI00107428F5|nr:class I SAM-dependent methyltransferase [Blastococcus sp. CT_GayMR20]TFV83254.1 class I SAM-dependent methyltransferase [Blastococcus sp. CT_GayMR20]